MEEKSLVHQHVLIQAYVTNPPMTEHDTEAWFRDLVTAIKMKICIPPRARYVDVTGNRGVTAVVGIETSHCAIHVWDEPVPAIIQMDVYSCAPFETATVIDALRKFGLIEYEVQRIDRQPPTGPGLDKLAFVTTLHERVQL